MVTGYGWAKNSCPNIPRLHERLDVGRIVCQGDHIPHGCADADENSLDVFQGLANLHAHIPLADHRAVLVQRNLALQMDHLTLTLRDRHRERPKRLPHLTRIEEFGHRPPLFASMLGTPGS